MSSNNTSNTASNTTYTADAKSVATKAVETGAYVAERAKQHTDSAQASGQGYLEHVKGLANSANDSLQNGVGAAKEKWNDTSRQATQATDDFQKNAKAHTDSAASEGQKDVEDAKASAGGYVEQAKSLAGSVLASAQGYVSAGQEQVQNWHPENNETTTSSIATTLHSTASTALETTKSYLASAQESLQPQTDKVKPHVENAASNV